MAYRGKHFAPSWWDTHKTEVITHGRRTVAAAGVVTICGPLVSAFNNGASAAPLARAGSASVAQGVSLASITGLAQAPAALSWPLLRRGSSGEPVISLQYLLNARGASLAVDGLFGRLTEAAVMNFQRSRGLNVDGVVGNQTWPAVIITVQRGSVGNAVRAVQQQLFVVRRYSGGPVDGLFGPKTQAAVSSFQHALGNVVDGIVGPRTWNALVREDLVRYTRSALPRRVLRPVIGQVALRLLPVDRAVVQNVHR